MKEEVIDSLEKGKYYLFYGIILLCPTVPFTLITLFLIQYFVNTYRRCNAAIKAIREKDEIEEALATSIINSWFFNIDFSKIPGYEEPGPLIRCPEWLRGDPRAAARFNEGLRRDNVARQSYQNGNYYASRTNLNNHYNHMQRVNYRRYNN